MSGPATFLREKQKSNQITKATGWGGLLPDDGNDLRKKRDFFLNYITFPSPVCVCVCHKAPSSSSCPLCADGDEKWMERSKSKCHESSCDMKDKKTTTFAHVFWGRERHTQVE